MYIYIYIYIKRERERERERERVKYTLINIFQSNNTLYKISCVNMKKNYWAKLFPIFLLML